MVNLFVQNHAPDVVHSRSLGGMNLLEGNQSCWQLKDCVELSSESMDPRDQPVMSICAEAERWAISIEIQFRFKFEVGAHTAHIVELLKHLQQF